MIRLQVDEIFPIAQLETIKGEKIKLHGGQGIIHLVLSRHSNCLFCNFEMFKYSGKLDKIKDAGITPVFVIQSSQEVILANQGEAPYASLLTLVADPTSKIYVAAKTTVSFMATVKSMWKAFTSEYASFYSTLKNFVTEKGVELHQVPANFLIDASTGKIMAAHYGNTLYDQWGAEEVVRIKRQCDKESGTRSRVASINTKEPNPTIEEKS